MLNGNAQRLLKLCDGCNAHTTCAFPLTRGGDFSLP